MARSFGYNPQHPEGQISKIAHIEKILTSTFTELSSGTLWEDAGCGNVQ